MKKILKILSTTVTVIMIAALVVLMCMGWLNISGRAFHVFGYAILRVQSGSMAPTYEQGDFLISQKVEPSELAEGDVITFYSHDPKIEGMLNTHRITAIEEINGFKVFTTKGDAVPENDKYKVIQDDLFGKVVYNVGFLKQLAEVLSISWVFAAIVFFPLLLLIFVEIRNIMRIIKRSKLNKQLEEMGLDPEDPSVSALAEKYGIEIFVNAANEIKSDCEETLDDNGCNVADADNKETEADVNGDNDIGEIKADANAADESDSQEADKSE